MAKQTINVGTTANDKKGDSLRAAFQKVNANFTELYEAVGLADAGQDTTLTFLGSTISTDDSSSIVIDRSTTVTSNLNVGGDLLPQTANGGDLGSSSQPWRSLYVSNSTVYLGGIPLSLDPNTNELKINNVPVSQTITYTDIPNVPTDVSDLTDNTGLLTAALTYTNFGDSGVRTDGGTGNNFWKPTIVDGTGTINKAGVYKTANNSNNSLFTFGANGAGVMSVLMDGSLFVGSTLPSNNGGLNTNFGGWLVVQAGGKFGGDLDTLGRVYLNGNQFEDDSGVLDFFSVSAGNHIVTCHSDWTLKLKARANGANQGNLWLEAGQNTKIKVKGNGSNIDIIASDGSSTATWNFAKNGNLTFPDSTVQTTAADFGYLDLDKDTIKGTAGYQYTFATDGYFTNSTSSESLSYFFVAYNTTNANIAAGWTVVGGTANTTVSSVTYPVAGYPGVIQVNLTQPAASTAGFYPVTVTSPDRLRVEIQPNPGTNDKFAFTTSGLTFPDATVQTTAYQKVNVPAHSYGVAGDKSGMVAFNDSYIYHCIADHRPLVLYTAARTNNGGSSFEFYQTAGTPLVGDRLYGDSGQGVITLVTASTEGGQPTWELTVTQEGPTSISIDANSTYNIGQSTIWKRIAQSAGTW